MVIFHSFLYVYQRVHLPTSTSTPQVVLNFRTPRPSVAKVLSGAMYSFRSSGFPQTPSAVRSLPRETSHGPAFVAEKAWKRAGWPRKHEENHGEKPSFWSNNPNRYITLRIWPGKQPWETPTATWLQRSTAPWLRRCYPSQSQDIH